MNRFIVFVLFILSILLTYCSQPPKKTQEINLIKARIIDTEEEKVIIEEQEEDIEKYFDQDKIDKLKEEKEEVDVKKQVMVEEITDVWEMFFDDQKAKSNDPRREMFEYYADEIADAIIYYQNNDTDIGGRMPKHRSAHLIVAEIITRESSVDPTVVGKIKNEVSMFQLHGEALGGYPAKVVQKNTRLAAMLGVRWIAHSTHLCNNINSLDKWTNEDWIRPISVYGAGPGKAYKNKKTRQCKKFTFAKRRVKRMGMYEMRIDANMNKVY